MNWKWPRPPRLCETYTGERRERIKTAVPSKEQKTCCGEDTKLRLIRPASISAFSHDVDAVVGFLCEFDGRNGPFPIVASDRDPQAVQVVEPKRCPPYRPFHR